MKIQQGITDNDYVYRLTRAEEQQLLHSVDQTVQINHDILVDIVDIIFRLSLLRKSLNHKLIVGGEHEQIDRHLRENGKNISGENSPHISGTLEKYRQENSATGYFGLTELRQNGDRRHKDSLNLHLLPLLLRNNRCFLTTVFCLAE
uniref:Uncharacterized protein n=1 Tax=Wuchereria bancrofti TaxID=6293 RepID=A0A1I8ECU7_WUCBA